MNYSYKKLEPGDLAALKDLRTVYARTFCEERSYDGEPPSESYLNALLANKNHIAIAASDDAGVVVGGLSAYVLPKLERERSEIYLYDLAVLEEHRKRGIATQLIETLKIHGKELGASVIFVQADNVDAPAIALYTKLSSSIERDITHFDIPI